MSNSPLIYVDGSKVGYEDINLTASPNKLRMLWGFNLQVILMIKSVEEWLYLFENKDALIMARLVLNNMNREYNEQDVDNLVNAFIAYATLSRRARMVP